MCVMEQALMEQLCLKFAASRQWQIVFVLQVVNSKLFRFHRLGQRLMWRKTRRFRRKLFVLRFRRQGAVRLGEVDDFRKQPLTEGCQGALP